MRREGFRGLAIQKGEVRGFPPIRENAGWMGHGWFVFGSEKCWEGFVVFPPLRHDGSAQGLKPRPIFIELVRPG